MFSLQTAKDTISRLVIKKKDRFRKDKENTIYRILHGKCARTVFTHELWRIRKRAKRTKSDENE